MAIPPIEEILVITPEVERAMGCTAAQIRKMTLRQFADTAFDRGLDFKFGFGGLVKGLTVQMTTPTSSGAPTHD